MTLGIDALDHGIQELNGWIKEIAERLGTDERRLAHCALRATLHALRDRVGPDHAAHLAQQLPLLVRSIFYDGYQPGVTPPRERSRGAFLEQVHIEGVQPLDLTELERAVKIVLAVLEARTDRAQIDNLIAQFPDEFADLFPPEVDTEAPPRIRKKQSVALKGNPQQSNPQQGKTQQGIVLKGNLQRHGPKHAVTPPETGIDEIDRSLQDALKWVNAVEFRMNTSSSRLAMSSLQATLQGIREQLSIEQAARFAEALPLPLKGAYYEGWHPSSPSPVATRQEFLDRIAASAFRDQSVAVERAVKAAMEVIGKKIGAAAMSEAAGTLPEDLRSLWPDEPAPYTDLRGTEPIAENVAPRQPPARGAKNIRRARNRAAGETTPNAVEPRSGKRAH